ncbi:UNVERIFIED_CONTAM: hypothetical protein Scaly_2898600 [Sesamum calycinum]|uniref:Reverse transcriptase zinc-binding domain-containing protein n=1 Tax=Sesamum calycinum TaxID=2727403 RepID=A0AAW2L9L9_9LAMI
MELLSYYWHEGDWNVPRILRTVPMPFAQTICQIPIVARQGDRIVWTGSSAGDFSTKSAWEAIRQASPQRQLLADIWHRSWRPTISVFLWRLFQDRIPVDARMRQKRFSFPSKCQCCEAEETVFHLFIKNTTVKGVWQHFVALFGLCLRDMGVSLICGMLRSIMGYHSRPTALFLRSSTISAHFPRAPSIVHWRAPSPSWFKLITDGSSFGNPSLAGAAGIIRDSAGHVHLAYQVALGIGTVCYQSSLPSGGSRVSGKWEVQHLIMRIVRLQKLLVVDVQHVFREANDAADHLAKEATSLQLTRVLHHNDITGVLRGILCLDRRGVPHLRRGDEGFTTWTGSLWRRLWLVFGIIGTKRGDDG